MYNMSTVLQSYPFIGQGDATSMKRQILVQNTITLPARTMICAKFKADKHYYKLTF